MILLTGAAGFVGSHVAQECLARGREVLGIDSLNDYYDPALKRARLARLERTPGFRFIEADIADHESLRAQIPLEAIEDVVHLAAQAGVRHSLAAPFAYERANVAGHLSILELCRRAPNFRHLVYASSSSVYGDRAGGPFRETDRCDTPASLYAATKRSCELMSETYARTFGLAQTGLRFFTVYGPWGRPDMAYWLFTDAILAGRPITLYGKGKLARDFTYVTDVAPTVAAIVDAPPEGASPPHEIYNIGNSNPQTVEELVAAIERASGREAIRVYGDGPAGDVSVTFAATEKAHARFGFTPRTRLADGIEAFVAWLRDYKLSG